MPPLTLRSLFLALSLTPAGVFAQSTTPAITFPLEVSYAGQSLNGQARLMITAQQCDQTSTDKLTFRANYNIQIPVLEGWIGKGTTDCSTMEARTSASASSSSPTCRRVFIAEQSTKELSFEALPRELFTTAAPSVPSESDSIEDDTALEDAGSTRVSDDLGCDLVTNQVYTLFFLALSQATDLSSNLAQPVIATPSGVLKAAFTLYTKRPEAPTDLVGIDGDSALTLTFTPAAGAPLQTKYRAYFDFGTGAEPCGSGALQGGQSAREESDTVIRVDAEVSATQGEAALGRLGSKGIELGDRVAASIVAIDPAGNESFLAEPVCMTRRVMIGGVHDAGGPDLEPDDSLLCSLQPSAHDSPWTLGLLCATALAFVTRRRS